MVLEPEWPDPPYLVPVESLRSWPGVQRPCPRCNGTGEITLSLASLPPYWRDLLRDLDGIWRATDELPLPDSGLASSRRQALVGLHGVGLIAVKDNGGGRYRYQYRITRDGVTILGAALTQQEERE